ncbi:FRIGIDA-like protein 3 isoform X2 [Selaginella moellendorffii]|uniref:FRIGIDA-like protein 3 isoform X2 n=1 Tax=Selaginella moellendorffii TaxID=88036 RepID=UPI000D1C6CCD|nr:FRIGIDA-like protein 3 isoform X2 [Selaginella moellendorffii]|eukprot:XP_024531745.1 FRIGIDA-like protein 3 isoform X2 [Selaginella moellendorffii]
MAGSDAGISHLSPVALALDDVLARRERIERAFQELESRRAALESCTIEWKQLEEHFAQVEAALRKRYEELSDREKALDDVEEGLSRREEAIAAREEASLARVQEQREAAIAAIVEEKRRLSEERQAIYLENPGTGIGNICNPEENCGSPASDHDPLAAQQQHSEESNDSPTNGQGSSGTPTKEATPVPSPAPKQPTVNSVVAEVRVRPELKTLCENMDGEGLRRYVSEHRKDVSALRLELPVAIRCAIDPARLVLDALEGYSIPSDSESGGGGGGGGGGDRKESGVSANRRACVLILESAGSALADPVLGVEHPVVPFNIKERAKELAGRWKSRMDVLKDSSGAVASENSLDAQVFLQLLATYGIAWTIPCFRLSMASWLLVATPSSPHLILHSPEYDDEELCRLVTTVARRRQSPALCRALGLAPKIPDVVDKLAKEGKQVEALAFAHAFEIMDRVEPVPLLKAYLKDARKSAQVILKSGNNSAAAQNDSSMKELSALKSVIKCIEEYKLDAQFPPQSLQKRIDVLERAKADRKRAAVAVKAQAKRPRACNGNGAVYGNGERSFYRPSDRAQFGGVGLSTYGLAPQTGYDRRNQGGFATTTYTGNRTPVSMSTSYLYSADGLGSSLYGSAAYGNPSYSSYQFGSGLPPPPPAYQASFLH